MNPSPPSTAYQANLLISGVVVFTINLSYLLLIVEGRVSLKPFVKGPKVQNK